MRESLAKAIRGALASDERLGEDDRVRVVDAAIRVYEAAKRGNEPASSSMAEIVRHAMRSRPGDCGCVGPRDGQKYCRCQIAENQIVDEAVASIRGIALPTPPDLGDWGSAVEMLAELCESAGTSDATWAKVKALGEWVDALARPRPAENEA